MPTVRSFARLPITCLVLLVCLPHSAPAANEKAAKYALLVGVKDYDHPEKLKSLNYPENDVSELASILRTAGYTVKLLTGTEGKKDPSCKPTLANIQKQLDEVLGKCNKGDMLLLAFAGHGVQFEKFDDECFFCPQDGLPLSDDTSIKTLLSLKGVLKQLGSSRGAVKLMLVDACRNDPIPGRSAENDSIRPPSGVAALFSCRAGERAYEHDNYRHGIFFYHILEGLRGKAKNGQGEVTWGSLQEYVQEQVSVDVARLLNGSRQTPTVNAGELSGKPILLDRSVTLKSRPKLCITFAVMDRATSERLKIPQTSQPQIEFAVPGGGGEVMGLRTGDILKRINGRDVPTVVEAYLALHQLEPGELVKMEVLRGKETLLLTGRNETALSQVEEVRRVREQAEKGDFAAWNHLGYLCETGEGVAKDDAEATKWYRKAAEQGNALGQTNLARAFQAGQGVAKSDVEAVKWFRRAADQGQGEAQASLGLMLEQGQGVPKNDAEAVKWFRKAAEQGIEEAQVNLGFMYLNGRGVPKNDGEAVKWYRKAAEQNSADGQYNLGVCYEFGRGVQKNMVEAKAWYQKAAEQKDEKAVQALKRFNAAP